MPVVSTQDIRSQKRMQQEDLGSMFMFSLVVNSLATEIAETQLGRDGMWMTTPS